MNQILVNKLIAPDGTVLDSRHRHDYKHHQDAITGEVYMVDGGMDYHRSNLNKVPGNTILLHAGDDHTLLREHFTWGTYGRDGDDPIKYVPLKDLTSDHIFNILEMTLLHRIQGVFEDELIYRTKEGIESPEEGSY